MAQNYLLLKTIHVLGAIIFVGNIVVTVLWKSMADQTRQPQTVAFGQRLVMVTDFAFTGVGAAAVLVSGLLMMSSFADEPLRVLWIRRGLELFAASGIIWIAVLIPVQIKQSRLARAFAAGGEIPDRYWTLGRIWMAAGIVATLLPLLNVYYMVYKPL